MQEPQEDSNESLWSSNGFPQVASRATFTYFKTEDGKHMTSLNATGPYVPRVGILDIASKPLVLGVMLNVLN